MAVADLPHETLDGDLEIQSVANDVLDNLDEEFEDKVIETDDEPNIFNPNLFFDDEPIEKLKPSYDEPSITGLEK